MIAFTNQRITLLITLGIGGLTLAYAFLIFVPGQRKLAEQKELLAEKQDFVVQSVQAVQQLAETRAELEQANAFVERWRAATPANRQAADLFGTISRFAQETGVNVNRFEPHTPQPLETIGQMNISLQVQGQFSQVHELFRRLESLGQTIWVQVLVIEGIREGQAGTTCEVTLAVFADRSGISD